MTQGKLPNRIPFEEASQFTNWAMPVVGGKIVPSVKRQDQQKPLPKQAHETVEDVAPENINLKPMTAQQLQDMSEEARREGFNEGYGEGLAKGLIEGEKQGLAQGKLKAYAEHSQELQQQAQGLAAICEALMEPLASQDRELENLVVNLAVKLAQHLLHSELEQRPEAIFPVVEAAFASLPSGARNLKVFLHPQDLEFVLAHAEALGKDWQCKGDGKISRGSCRVETAQSLVDYNIEARLKAWLEQIKQKPVTEERPVLDDLRPLIEPPPSHPGITHPALSSVEVSEAEMSEADLSRTDVNQAKASSKKPEDLALKEETDALLEQLVAAAAVPTSASPLAP